MIKQVDSNIICFKEGCQCLNKNEIVTHPSAFVRDYCNVKKFEVARFEPAL